MHYFCNADMALTVKRQQSSCLLSTVLSAKFNKFSYVYIFSKLSRIIRCLRAAVAISFVFLANFSAILCHSMWLPGYISITKNYHVVTAQIIRHQIHPTLLPFPNMWNFMVFSGTPHPPSQSTWMVNRCPFRELAEYKILTLAEFPNSKLPSKR